MKRTLSIMVVLLTGFAAGSLFVGSWLHGQPVGLPPAARERDSYRDVVKRVLPAVVFIETYAKGQSERLGFGSGFFIDSSGVIVTNYHVVEGAENAVVQTPDGRKYSTKNIRTDRRTDLAVILLDVKVAKFPTLEMGDSDVMEIGDRVLAVGAPFGLAGSVTQGIISGKARSGLQMNMYEDFLQTDAAINPGNSGGPLISLDGRVVGVCAAIKSKTGGFQGVGLATSSNLAKSVVFALRTKGVVERGYLGAHILELDPDSADKLGLAKTGGVLLAEIYDKTPASKGGLKAGDILTTINGKTVKNGDALQRMVASLPVNQAVDVDVLRAGKPERVTVIIEPLPPEYGTGSPEPQPAAPMPRPLAGLDALGVDVVDLTDDIAADLRIKRGTVGVVVVRIHEGSLASASSMKPGTVITKIGDAVVTTPVAALKAMQAADLRKGVILQIVTPQGMTTHILVQSLR